jgi:hypothetical protein
MTRVDGALGVLADRLLRGGLLDSVPRVVLASLLLQTPAAILPFAVRRPPEKSTIG